MGIDKLDDAVIRDILTRTRRIAVVGASAKPERPSFGVMRFLLARGFDVTPVNPGLAGQQIQGRAVVADLAGAAPLDMVDLFRASEHVGPVVDEAIRLRARTVWMQIGVVDEAAAVRASAAGLRVVMDRCPAIEWPRLAIPRTIIPRA
jgi:predicted CoA-binding protein